MILYLDASALVKHRSEVMEFESLFRNRRVVCMVTLELDEVTACGLDGTERTVMNSPCYRATPRQRG